MSFPSLSTASAGSTCGGGTLNPCRSVLAWTGNPDMAKASEWFVEHALVPTVTIVLLVVGGAILRWVAHRSIDRVVSRAQEGVLPTRLGSFGRSSAEGDVHLRHRLSRGVDVGEVLRERRRRALELGVPARAEVRARRPRLLEVEDVLGEREPGDAGGSGRAQHGGAVAVGDEVVVVVVQARHRAVSASASRKAPATSSRDQSWQS